MTTRRALLGATLALPALSTARAQDAWPERAVRMVVPFPPGQAADIFARVMAAGAIGMDAVARATPDGYTLGIGTSGTLGVNPSVMARLPYDAEKDFAAITNIFTLPLVFVAHPSFEASDMAGLVALARAQPGMVQYASAGPGTAQHMTAEMLDEPGRDFGRYLDVDGDGIPYRTYPGAHPEKGAYFTRGTSRDRYARYSEEGGVYVDGTFGAGGYSRAILDIAGTRVIGIDRDRTAILGGFDLVDRSAGRLTL
ncbi:MAG: 16S rRNA (cytosine(1402)-N(4))-methyltransferase, partial [Rhodospirillales bacterium 12-71-4]